MTTLDNWHVTVCRCPEPHGWHLHESRTCLTSRTQCLRLGDFLTAPNATTRATQTTPRHDDTHPATMIGRRP